MTEIIDVTMRDGGFTCDFNWPLDFAQEYYNMLSNMDKVTYLELGYWMQDAKSSGPYYHLDMEKVKKVTQDQARKNVSVMIDYHYCKKDLNLYPTNSQTEIGMIRMTARKDMIDEAVYFAEKLREKIGIPVSFNIFNISNYSFDEIKKVVDKVIDKDFDYIYMADTHGNINLDKNILNYEEIFSFVKESGKKTGFHLHNHTGRAFSNFLSCDKSKYIDSCDTSIMSLGKGAGNLRLENVVSSEDSLKLSIFIEKYYEKLFKKSVSPYYLVTGRQNITDNYALEAEKKGVNMSNFIDFCRSVKGLDRDNYDKNLLGRFLS